MVMITGIRAPLPVIDAPAKGLDPAAPTHLSGKSQRPIAQTQLVQAVQQFPAKPTIGEAHILEAQVSAETSATAAAEVARDAYIKASIAAGINPLPLS